MTEIIIVILVVWMILGFLIAKNNAHDQKGNIAICRCLLFGPVIWLLLIILGCENGYDYMTC